MNRKLLRDANGKPYATEVEGQPGLYIGEAVPDFDLEKLDPELREFADKVIEATKELKRKIWRS